MNECAGKPENLLFWSPKEDFPSLGIGHFIWYPAAGSGPYRESFPGFIEYARRERLGVPDWLDVSPVPPAPWPTRAVFHAEQDSARSNQLRAFLERTRRAQARFILDRFRRIFPDMLMELDTVQRIDALQKYKLMLETDGGPLAMVDYTNFKGEGLQTDARYDGYGWGLAQVLLEMDVPDDPARTLEAFVEAAERVLERRVARAPKPEIERGWLPGWRKRVRSYLNTSC